MELSQDKTKITIDSQICAVDQELLSTELGEERVLLNLKNGQYYGINSVGERIWQLLQKPAQIEQISQTIQKEYGVEAEDCKTDVLNFIETLRDNQLVKVL